MMSVARAMPLSSLFVFFFNDTATTEIYTLSLHDALPISSLARPACWTSGRRTARRWSRSEEHTSELQSPCNLVCRLLLEKKKQSNTIRAAPCFASPRAGLTTDRQQQ